MLGELGGGWPASDPARVCFCLKTTREVVRMDTEKPGVKGKFVSVCVFLYLLHDTII